MEGIGVLFQHFADLLEPVIKFFIWAFPIKIYTLDDGERGVVLSFGKVRRKHPERGPGITICFAFEEMRRVQALGGFRDFTPQTVQTKDKKMLVISGAAIYEVVNVKKALLETEDMEQMLESICMNELREFASTKRLTDISCSEKITESLGNQANKKLKKYGMKVYEFIVTDLSPHEMSLLCDTLKTGIKIRL